MRSTSGLLALAASLSAVASATQQGFNYGSTKSDGSFMFQQDYEDAFSTANSLVGTTGFNSARLYTMIQGGSSTNEPTQAIPAAIAQKTSLLLGLWASGGDGPFDAELTALNSAIQKYGSAFTDLVAGISVGSEDLYRVSPTGIEANSGAGADPATIASYIGKLRQAISSTSLSKASVGHVDTWTAWVNGSNQAVIDAVDWVGVDAYPYFQSTMSNSVDSGKSLFEDALSQTQSAVGGKEVWITETGWPVSGKTSNLGVPSTDNAKKYWDDVGCPRFGNVNIFWYTLQDSAPVTPDPSFGVVGSTLSTTPLFDLSCSNTGGSKTSNSSTGGSSASKSHPGSAGATGGPTAVGTGTGSVPTGPNGNYSASIGGGNGSGIKTSAVGGVGGNGNGNGAGAKTSAPGSSPSSTSPAGVNANAAPAMSASFIGAVGALFAAIVAL